MFNFCPEVHIKLSLKCGELVNCMLLSFIKKGSNERLRAKDDSAPSWNILREDFMMGASMKDWDKVSDSDTNSDPGNDDPDEDNFDSSEEDT